MLELKNLTDKFRINLKHLRNIHGFSQSTMAKHIGVSTRGYQRIESGDSLPTLDLIFKMAHTLSIDVSELFNYLSDNDSYFETTRSEITSFEQGDEFINFKDELLYKYSSLFDAKESDWMKTIASDDFFLTNQLSVYISDLVNTVTNISCSNILSRKAGTKMISGSKLKEQKNKISIINRIFEKDEVYFKTSFNYDFGSTSLNTNNCNFYKRLDSGDTILIGYIIDFSRF